MPFLKEDEAPTQEERKHMPAHLFGLPDEKKYPLDTPEHVRSNGDFESKHPRDENGKFSGDSAVARDAAAVARADSNGWQRVKRIDFAGTISDKRATSIGGRVVRANLTRTGVLTYRMPDGSVRRELRHPDEVFSKGSLASLAHATVTDDHPGRVHPGNWRQETIGHLDGEPHKGKKTRDGEDTVESELRIEHGPAIDKLDAGKLQECSAGYDCSYDPTPGTWNGIPYDGQQRDIRYNHIAVGPSGWGRAGPEVRMHLDSGASVSGVEEMTSASFALDTGSTTRAGAPTKMPNIEDPQAALDKAKTELETANARYEALRADATNAKGEIARLTAELALSRADADKTKAENEVLRLQSQRPTDDTKIAAQKVVEENARIDRMIGLRGDAKSVFGEAWKHDSKSEHAIRCEIISKLEPEFQLDGKGEEVIAAVYPSIVRHDAAVKAANAKIQEISRATMDAAAAGPDDEMDPEEERKKMDALKKDAWKMTPSRKDRMRMRSMDVRAGK